MENYIVRISRRDAKDPDKLTGQVEIVGTEEKKAFRNVQELMEILIKQKVGSDVRFCVE